ncbi:MAG TPA: DUF1844 domain-containing protein [Thermoanaerobaculia bacterium]|nr:DUF1844 domain-containing protein [Thermoanaerobaculia bacterium]
MSTDKKAPKELKVTDKRIFTADGEIKDEFKNDIHAAEPSAATAAAEAPKAEAAPSQAERRQETPKAETRQRTEEERGTNPGTPFAHFLESLIMQAYMSLGMLRNPYAPQAKPEPAAARQMIDILTMLKEKTAGNLTPEEEDFLDTHLGELKLAYVQRTKNI